MIPTFGGKKVQPAFQVKVAAAVALPGKNSSTAASPLVVRFPNPLALPKASEAGNLTRPVGPLNFYGQQWSTIRSATCISDAVFL